MTGLAGIGRGVLMGGCALILTLPSSLLTTANGSQEIRVLEKGRPIEQELKGGETHTYQVRLAGGQSLHIDVSVRIVGPGRNAGSPNAQENHETAW